MKIGFDHEKYIELQSENILKRVEMFNNKLYLELGGKLFDDFHAARVLPGFHVDAKIEVLKKLKDKLEILFCINASDIEKSKINSNIELTYDMDVLRLIEELRGLGFTCNSVVITLYKGQPSADVFKKKLERMNIKTYLHTFTKGYPTDIDTIVSEEGYGANEYIKTTKPIVVVAAPGPGSGKLATCLSQLYYEHKNNNKAGYAKFETFPIWNLPLKHPVNIAYEAATADLKDINLIDNFHLEKYGVTAVNYNRDLEMFPVLKKILNKITNEDIYSSPTDMGVNMIGDAIIDDEVVKNAAYQEIIRRYYRAMCDYKMGVVDEDIPQRINLLLNEVNSSIEDRKVVVPALEKSKKEGVPAIAIELSDGRIITGKNTKIMSCSASAIINSLKELAGINDKIDLLSPNVLNPMLKMKEEINNNKKKLLSAEDVLLGLSICKVTNPLIDEALSHLDELKHCEAHASHFLPSNDVTLIRKLGMNLTNEAEFYIK